MTFHVHLKDLFRRKPLVLVAVLLMTASALLSWLCVNRDVRQIGQLMQQSQKLDAFIHDEWSDIGQINRDADDAVIISLLAKSDDAEARAVRKHYVARLGNRHEEGKSLADILKETDNLQQARVNTINDNYVRQTAIESDIARLERRNMFYTDLAFILQVIGLLMVIITRDMPDQI